MDFSRLSQAQIVVGIAGIVLVISQFLSWASILGVSESAFDAFSGMDIIMLIVGLAGVAFAAAIALGRASSVPSNAGFILCALGLIVFGWALGWDLESGDAGIGAWLALLASAAIAWGGFISAGGAGVRLR